MTRRFLKRGTACLAVMIAAAGAVPARASEGTFTLASVVPENVYIFVNGQHNPERAFLEAYWTEVLDALKESKIGDDAWSMISSFMDEEGLAEVERLKTRAEALLGGVEWSKLVAREVAFAERMSMPMSPSPGSVQMGPPEVLTVFRGEHGVHNFAGLTALLEGAVDEINRFGGTELTVQRSKKHGADIASVSLIKMGEHSFEVSVAQRSDMVIIAMGSEILDECLGLMDGKGKALADNAKFKKAFASLPKPEDTMVFFDMQTLMKPLGSLAKMAMTAASGPEDVYLNTRLNDEANALNARAIAAYGSGDIKEALKLIQEAHEVAPTDSVVLYNLACFNALSDHPKVALDWLAKSVDAGFYAPAKIASDSDFESVRDDARFKSLVKKSAELAAKNKEHSGDGEKDRWMTLAQRLLDRAMNSVNIMDYAATVEYTDGYSVRSESTVALVADAKSRPIYPVFAKRAQRKDFDRYLPEETQSFAIGNGVDLAELYTFLEDTLRGAGPQGEEWLGVWEGMQKEHGFDIRRDLLDWMHGAYVQVTLADGGGSVLMVQVHDGEMAKAKVNAVVEGLQTKIPELAAQQPMLGMLTVSTSPSEHEKLEGFQNLQLAMNPQGLVWGIADGHLVFGTSANAIAICLDTAKGEHPGIRKNAMVMQEAIVPSGAFTSASLTDMSKLGPEMGMVLGMMSMGMGMASMGIPDPDARTAISKITSMIGKLSPVVAKIDFIKSAAAETTFDGMTWRVKTATHYFDPAKLAADDTY